MSETAGNKRPFSNMHSIDRESHAEDGSFVSARETPLPVDATSENDVPKLDSDEQKRNYISDNRVSHEPNASQDFVSADWSQKLVRDEPPGQAVRGIGAAGEKVVSPVFRAITEWYGLDTENVAVRVAYEGSDDRIGIYNFAVDAQISSLGTDVRSSVIYSSYISDAVVRQSVKLDNSTFGDSKLSDNESLIVMRNSLPQTEHNSDVKTAASEDESWKQPPERPIGHMGLGNMGNTCFMNSSLQALSHIPEFVRYFGSGDYVKDSNRTNPIGCNGQVADAFAQLVRETYGNVHESSIRPWEFRATIGRFNRSFASRMQQDSQEFTAFLLDSLHEDLNRVHNKPATEKPELKDDDNPRDSEVVQRLADESWKTHKSRNDSPIVDLFTGMYKSTSVCPVCSKVSITFDPFFDLTSPLPRNSVWLKTLKVVPADPSKHSIATEVSLTPNSTVEESKQQVADDILHLPPNYPSILSLVDLYDHKVYRVIEDRRIVSASIDSTDEIIVYEHLPLHLSTENNNDNHEKSVLVYLRHNDDETGIPFFITIKSLQKAEIEEAVLSKIAQIHGVNDRDKLNPKINIFRGSVDDISHRFGRLPVEPLEPEPIESANDVSHEPFEKIEPLQSREEKPLTIDTKVASDQPSSTVSSPSPLSSPSSPSPSSVPSVDSPLSEIGANHYNTQNTGPKPIEFNDDFVFVVDIDMSFEDFSPDHVDAVTNQKAVVARESMQNRKEFTLEDSLRCFENPEVSGDNDEWYCPRCKDFRKAEKQLELWRVPDISMIHLKRFSGAHSMAHKVDDLVKFPLESSDSQPYISDNTQGNENDYVYDSFAVDNHFGGMGGGHYTAYVRDPFTHNNSEIWLDFNDSFVSTVDKSDVCSPAAYSSFYRRRKAPDTTEQAKAVVEKLQAQNIEPDKNDVFVGQGQRLGTTSSSESAALPWQ